MDYREIFEQTRKTLAQKGYEIRDKDIEEYVGTVFIEYEFTLKKCRGWRFGDADEEDLIEAFGWKYKLFKHFRKTPNKNAEKY